MKTPSRNGEWKPQPSMINPRAAHAVVSSETAIYALAGTGQGGRPVLDVERFDGKAWSHETRLPGDGLNAPAAVLLGQKIYLIGGFNTITNVPSDAVLVYDLATKTWEHAASLPAPRGGHAAAVLNGKIHVVGGGNSRSTIADHSVYDPSDDRWETRVLLPRAEGSPALVAFAGKLYAIGGRSGQSDFGDVYIYDPAINAWTAGPLLEPRGTAGAAVYCGAIHVFGGESQARNVNLNSVLRMRADGTGWETVSPMPTARNFARAVLFNGAVYVVGGSLLPGSSHSSEGSAIVESYHSEFHESHP